jgi:hypothetical protein
MMSTHEEKIFRAITAALILAGLGFAALATVMP